MTTTATDTTDLRSAVVSIVGALQGAYLSDVPSAAARLARLRRALTAPAGSVSDVWQDTIGRLPVHLLGRGDEPSPSEDAAHGAICLYALHQQSQRFAMHVRDESLGTAVQRLSRARDEPEEGGPIRARFHALATANAHPEVLWHLRGLVLLLRSEKIGLDYGRLATDLRDLRGSSRGAAVRLRWGRDLHRPLVRRDADAPTTTDAQGEPV